MRSRPELRLAAACAIAATALSACRDAPDAPPPAQEAHAGLARVEVVWRDASGAERTRAFGTAFRVGPQALVTAQHVAANARTERSSHGEQSGARLRVVLEPEPGDGAAKGPERALAVRVAAEEPAADLALLRIVGTDPGDGAAGSARPPAIAAGAFSPLARSRPPADSAISLVGYPTGERDLVVRSGRVLDPVRVEGDSPASAPLPEWIGDLLRDGSVLFAEVETRLGNSGSPVYLDESGEIVGLCSSLLARNELARANLIPIPGRPGEPVTLVISAQRIRSFLDAHGVPGH
jgi:hypothetical protein